MAKDIKVSYMKIVLLISSILALVMPYMIVEMTILLEISASYYLTEIA